VDSVDSLDSDSEVTTLWRYTNMFIIIIIIIEGIYIAQQMRYVGRDGSMVTQLSILKKRSTVERFITRQDHLALYINLYSSTCDSK